MLRCGVPGAARLGEMEEHEMSNQPSKPPASEQAIDEAHPEREAHEGRVTREEARRFTERHRKTFDELAK